MSQEIPVPRHLVPPSGCPKHGIKSIEECGSPTNSSVCLEFCSKGKSRTARERLAQMPTPTTALDALALLLTATAADLDEGKINTEEAQKLWEGINKDLQNPKAE